MKNYNHERKKAYRGNNPPKVKEIIPKLFHKRHTETSVRNDKWGWEATRKPRYKIEFITWREYTSRFMDSDFELFEDFDMFYHVNPDDSISKNRFQFITKL